MAFPPAEPAGSTCSGHAQPGAGALMAWCIDAFGERGAFNLGIYNCRTVAGSTVRSTHGEGRAIDVGFPLVNGAANPNGTTLARLLVAKAGPLGVQRVIWNRVIWDLDAPAGRPYGGVSPHVDHIHAELTWNAALTLTLARVREVMTPPTPTPAPAPTPTAPQEDTDVTAYIRLNVSGHPHNGRVEAIGDFHRRHIATTSELQTLQFLGAKIQNVTVAQWNVFTANKTVVNGAGIKA